jgi:NADH:ubiquinone oxidoreductase subunit F (NADH-binding)
MPEYRMLSAGFESDVAVLAGPLMMRGVPDGPALPAHLHHWGRPRPRTAADLIQQAGQVRLAGRGGAAFPFARKLQAALDSGRRREVVVNAAESEPASAKDGALLTAAPHLVLDGAELVAGALGAPAVHLVVPGERPRVAAALETAVRERDGAGPEFVVHRTTGGFVGGQARAVVELLSGRANLPVTAWQPEAVSGVRGKPTLVSNAETFAQVAALTAVGVDGYATLGAPGEPGTRLLSVAADGPGGVVLEVAHGVPLGEVLQYCGHAGDAPALVGGYHGTWLSGAQVAGSVVSTASLAAVGARLGAGVVLPLVPGDCPVGYTAQIVGYLAERRAQRCGPCTSGLPALARACAALAQPGPTPRAASAARIRHLCDLVEGRGACQHPDGTARLTRSLLDTFPQEIAHHEHGHCSAR